MNYLCIVTSMLTTDVLQLFKPVSRLKTNPTLPLSTENFPKKFFYCTILTV